MTQRRSEGSRCECGSPEEHAKLVANVDESFKRDYDGSRMRLALQVSTSEALRRRALVPKNGHM
jgi:hypothetical protein